MCASSGFNELAGYTKLAAGLSDTSFQHIADAKLASNLLDIDGLAFVSEARIPRDDKQGLEPRQRGDDVVDHPVSKVLLLRVSAHVLKRQNRNGRFVGKGKRGRFVSCRTWRGG